MSGGAAREDVLERGLQPDPEGPGQHRRLAEHRDLDPRREREPEGRHYRCRLSSGRLVVLVDEAAEAVAAVDGTTGRGLGLACASRLRRTQVERAVRPLTVVVVDEHAEDVIEVAAVSVSSESRQ